MNRHEKTMARAMALIQSESLPVDAMEQFDALEQGADEITLSCLADLRATLHQEMVDQGMMDNIAVQEEKEPSAQPAPAGAHGLNSVVTSALAKSNQADPMKQEQQIEAAVAKAATSPGSDLPEPTDAQKLAGNYKKAKLNIHGLNIVIENPKDSTRSGIGSDGKEWTSTMTCHYGDIQGVTGADGDKMDVFVGPDVLSNQVFVIDQVDPDTGEFDEHKVMLCCDGQEQARALYLSNYDEGWGGLGAITELSLEEFKEWIKGDVSGPLGDLTQS